MAAELGVSTSALYRWVADRDALLDLVSAAMVERILPDRMATGADWQTWLIEWAHNVRRECAAVPGFAVRVLTGPHRAAGHDQLHRLGVRAFLVGGATPDYAQQCWYAFTTAVVEWIAAEHNLTLPGAAPMQFDTLLQILLRGTGLAPAHHTERAAPNTTDPRR